MNKGFTYTLNIDADIKNLQAKTAQVKKSMETIMAAGKAPGAEQAFTKIEQLMTRIQDKAAQPITSVAMFNSVQKDASALGVQLSKLEEIVGDLGNMSDADKMELIPPDLKQKIQQANTALQQYNNTVKQAEQKSEALTNAETALANAQKELNKAQGKVAEKKALIDAHKAQATEIENQKKALQQLIATTEAYNKVGADKSKAGKDTGKAEVANLDLPKDQANVQAMFGDIDTSSLDALNAKLQELTATQKLVEQNQRAATSSLSSWQGKAQVAGQSVTALKSSVDKLNQEFEETKGKNISDAYTKLRTEAGKLGVDLRNIPTDYTEQNFQELEVAMSNLAINGLESVEQGLKDVGSAMPQVTMAADQFGTQMTQASADVEKLDQKVSNTKAFAQRIAQFVGLQGGIQLARRAMQSAFSTIKELDEAMTEMAVVTDLGIGDYWNQLGEHTERANALGVAIKDVYKAETLYYQQGLKTNEVIGMSTETLKMARIAGLSAEDATNKMTAALRGFNMELNETSAQRVADVYSELAAITASDVDEISNAMTKTASIAASAGMEFETTAAFLSQIIETTRESAETAGTALKTVIARFQELKKDPAEIGEVDGEVVDANKIETALRTVGVSLRDASGQFRELDDVFLELSSKWDGLDTNTQRYIATVAAGSRQQSRFIAMMSDYGRTQELVSAANNSAGASNQQFEKTLDSLQSKLEQLKNAWNTFTMTLMNSEFLKTIIDILVGIMNAINGVVAAFDKIGLGGPAALGMVIAALYLGAKAVDIFNASLTKSGSILTAFGTVGSKAFGAITSGITKTFKAIKNLPKTFQKMGTSVKNAGKSVSSMYSGSVLKAQENYRKAVERENHLEQQRYMLKTKAAAQEGKNVTLNNLSANAEVLSAQATAKRAAAEAALFAAMELTDDQKKEAVAMTGMGVAAENAGILSKFGFTAATIAQGAAEEELTEEQYAANLANTLESASTVKATIAKGLNALATKLQAKADKGGVGAKTAHTVATWLQTAATWALNAAMWQIILVIFAIIAAIAILVVAVIGIIALFKAWQKSTPEAKLKAAQQAMETASQAAEEAKEAYDNLRTSLEDLSEKYEMLEDLTEGTKEWKTAVKELNAEVLELIETYPELAKYVTRDENGVLQLDTESEGVQEVLNDYEKKATRLKSVELASKRSVIEKTDALSRSNLSDDARVDALDADTGQIARGSAVTAATYAAAGSVAGPVGAAVGGLIGAIGGAIGGYFEADAAAERQTDKLAEAMKEGLLVEGENGWEVVDGGEEQLEAIGLTVSAAESFANSLGEGADELYKYSQQLKQSEESMDALYEAQLVYVNELVDTADMTQEQIKQIQGTSNVDLYKEIEAEKLKAATEKTDYTMDKNERDYVTDMAQKIYGTSDIEYDDDVVYIGEGDDKQEVSIEEFRNQIAAYEAGEEYANRLENLPKAIDKVANKLGVIAGKAYEKATQDKEGKNLTKKDLEALQKYSNNISKLQEAWDELSEDEKKAFGSFDRFVDSIQQPAELAETAFKDAVEGLEEMGLSEAITSTLISGDMTAEAAKGYAEKLEAVFASAGEAGVLLFDDSLDQLGALMSESDFNALMGQLNSMDWKNMNDWEKLPETLREMGLNVPTKELEAFIATSSKMSGAIRQIDLDKLNENIQSLQSLSSKVKSGEQGRTFSESDYESLIQMDSSLMKDFQQTLSGDFVYLGSSMTDLTEAIHKNTAAMLKEAAQQLQEKVDMGQLMDWWSKHASWEDGTKADISQWRTWEEDASTSNARGYLDAIINSAVKNGIDLNKLGIAELSNGTKVQSLKEYQVESIMDSLSNIFNNLQKNAEELSSKVVNSLSLTYQNRDATINSQMASSIRMKLVRSGKLEESDQNGLKASQNAIAAQATTAGVNSYDIGQYTANIAALEDLQQQYSDGKISISEYRKQAAGLRTEIEQFEKSVSNKTNLVNLNNNLAATLEPMGELQEQLDKMGGDVRRKVETVASALGQLGISVTEQNYEHLAELTAKMAQGGEEGVRAYQELLATAGSEYGMSIDEVYAMSQMNWNESTMQMTKEQQEFTDRMVASGMAMWQEMANGSRKFVLLNEDNLNSAAETAGTIFEAWENPYDWLYSYNEQINALIKERERSERSYNRVLEDESKTASDLLALSKAELENLEQQAKLRTAGAFKAESEIEKLLAENSEFSKFINFDKGTKSLAIDYNGADAAGFDTDQGSEFEELVGKIEENRDVILDSEDALYDIQDQIEEIKDRGKEETSELYNQIKEGLIAERQEEIDKLQGINDSIQEMQSALVDQMQKQIDDARQARENEQMEGDIADKETRLAYLMQDTSGRNAMEIASLQQEIANDKQGYTDSLVDQQLQSLQDANEAAAEQRQQQIDLQQAQLDMYANSAEIWAEVEAILIASQLQAQAGMEFANTNAGELILNTSNLNEMNPIEAQDFKDELEHNGKLSTVYSGIAAIDSATASAVTADEELQTLLMESLQTGGAITGGLAGIVEALTGENGSISHGLESIVSALIGEQENTLSAATKGVGETVDALQKALAGEQGAIGLVKDEITEGWRLVAGDENSISSKIDKSQSPDYLAARKTENYDATLQALKDQASDEAKKKAEAAEKERIAKEEAEKAAQLAKDRKLDAQKQAIQAGIHAVTSFTSGGTANLANNKAYQDARKKYEDNDGTNFYDQVAEAITSGSSDYSYGESYNVDQKLNTTGTFPGATVKGQAEGAGDWYGDYDQVDITIPYDGKQETATVQVDMNKTTDDSAKLNKLYADAGKTPGPGWVAMYNSVPYIMDYNKTWRPLKDNDGRGKLKNYMLGALNPYRFKTGGLADFTGPAWLDGTKSKPEIVLNQTDSANFMQLRDILADILNGTSSIPKTKEGKGGDNYYDIEISVESLGDDYDVEQLAEKIKSMIYDDAIYRNVNSVNTVR